MEVWKEQIEIFPSMGDKLDFLLFVDFLFSLSAVLFKLIFKFVVACLYVSLVLIGKGNVGLSTALQTCCKNNETKEVKKNT